MTLLERHCIKAKLFADEVYPEIDDPRQYAVGRLQEALDIVGDWALSVSADQYCVSNAEWSKLKALYRTSFF